MKKKLCKKMFMIGFIVLFIQAGVMSGLSVDTRQDYRLINYEKEEYMVFKPCNCGSNRFNATDDAFISQTNQANNYGASQTMDVRSKDGSGSSNYWERDSLIRFNLSSIQPGTTFDSATLYLYYYTYKDNNPKGRSLTAHRITSNWNEETATWNTRPSIVSSSTDSDNVPGSPGVWMEWDVTSDVQAFINGVENFGWMIKDNGNWNLPNIPITRFRTKEYGGEFVPHLIVDYGGGNQCDITITEPEIEYIYILGEKYAVPGLNVCIYIDFGLKCKVDFSGNVDEVHFHVECPMGYQDTIIDPTPPFECTFRDNLESGFLYTITATAYNNGQICDIDEVYPIVFLNLNSLDL